MFAIKQTNNENLSLKGHRRNFVMCGLVVYITMDSVSLDVIHFLIYQLTNLFKLTRLYQRCIFHPSNGPIRPVASRKCVSSEHIADIRPVWAATNESQKTRIKKQNGLAHLRFLVCVTLKQKKTLLD